MLDVLKFACSSFWVFCGCGIIFSCISHFVIVIWNRGLRHWNIRKHGYPPEHCDADGDFKKMPKGDD